MRHLVASQINLAKVNMMNIDYHRLFFLRKFFL
jgi:hypothetical protein